MAAPTSPGHPEAHSAIYHQEAGELNRDIISYYSARLAERYVKGKRAVQMGLGDSYVADELSPRFEHLTVVEGSGAIVRERAAQPMSFELVESLFEDYRPTQRFDFLLGNHVLEHLDDPIAVLRATRDWLVPGGLAIFSVPNAHSLHRRIGVEMGLLPELWSLNEQDHELGHRRVYRIPELVADIEAAGYKTLEIRGYVLKVVSNKQMKGWSRELLDAMFRVSTSLAPELCSSVAVICESPAGNS